MMTRLSAIPKRISLVPPTAAPGHGSRDSGSFLGAEAGLFALGRSGRFPEVAHQTSDLDDASLGETVPSPMAAGPPIQRKLVFQYGLETLGEELKKEPVFKLLAGHKETVLVKKGLLSQTFPNTPLNKDKVTQGVSVEITLSEKDLKGLTVDPKTTFDLQRTSTPFLSGIPKSDPTTSFGFPGLDTLSVSHEVDEQLLKAGLVPDTIKRTSLLAPVLSGEPQWDEVMGEFSGERPNILPMLLPETETIPIFDIRRKGDSLSSQTRPPLGMIPNLDKNDFSEIVGGNTTVGTPPKNLSGATVLLHEMAHAVQYLTALPIAEKTRKQEKGKQLLGLPVLSDVAQLTTDIEQGRLDTPLWTLRVFELAEMGMILGILRDLPKGDTKGLDELDALRMLVLDRVKIWMEHDVMINTEHPFAASRGEGIRLRHGEELDQRIPSVVKSKYGRRELERKELEDRTIDGKDRLDLPGARREMTARLQKDSKDLPKNMAELVKKYKSLGVDKELIGDHVDPAFYA